MKSSVIRNSLSEDSMPQMGMNNINNLNMNMGINMDMSNVSHSPASNNFRPSEATRQLPQRRRRRKLSPVEIKELEAEFSASAFPSIFHRNFLAKRLGLTPRQVQVWFQNRRVKERKKILGNVSGGNSGNSGSLDGDNYCLDSLGSDDADLPDDLDGEDDDFINDDEVEGNGNLNPAKARSNKHSISPSNSLTGDSGEELPRNNVNGAVGQSSLRGKVLMTCTPFLSPYQSRELCMMKNSNHVNQNKTNVNVTVTSDGHSEDNIFADNRDRKPESLTVKNEEQMMGNESSKTGRESPTSALSAANSAGGANNHHQEKLILTSSSSSVLNFSDLSLSSSSFGSCTSTGPTLTTNTATTTTPVNTVTTSGNSSLYISPPSAPTSTHEAPTSQQLKRRRGSFIPSQEETSARFFGSPSPSQSVPSTNSPSLSPSCQFSSNPTVSDPYQRSASFSFPSSSATKTWRRESFSSFSTVADGSKNQGTPSTAEGGNTPVGGLSCPTSLSSPSEEEGEKEREERKWKKMREIVDTVQVAQTRWQKEKEKEREQERERKYMKRDEAYSGRRHSLPISTSMYSPASGTPNFSSRDVGRTYSVCINPSSLPNNVSVAQQTSSRPPVEWSHSSPQLPMPMPKRNATPSQGQGQGGTQMTATTVFDSWNTPNVRQTPSTPVDNRRRSSFSNTDTYTPSAALFSPPSPSPSFNTSRSSSPHPPSVMSHISSPYLVPGSRTTSPISFLTPATSVNNSSNQFQMPSTSNVGDPSGNKRKGSQNMITGSQSAPFMPVSLPPSSPSPQPQQQYQHHQQQLQPQQPQHQHQHQPQPHQHQHQPQPHHQHHQQQQQLQPQQQRISSPAINQPSSSSSSFKPVLYAQNPSNMPNQQTQAMARSPMPMVQAAPVPNNFSPQVNYMNDNNCFNQFTSCELPSQQQDNVNYNNNNNNNMNPPTPTTNMMNDVRSSADQVFSYFSSPPPSNGMNEANQFSYSPDSQNFFSPQFTSTPYPSSQQPPSTNLNEMNHNPAPGTSTGHSLNLSGGNSAPYVTSPFSTVPMSPFPVSPLSFSCAFPTHNQPSSPSLSCSFPLPFSPPPSPSIGSNI